MRFGTSLNSSAMAVAAVVALVAGSASAQTVTVDASNGSPNNTTTFNTVSAALASFATGGVNGSDAAANVINVVAGTAVVDKIVFDDDPAAGANRVTINGGVTIQGTGGRAVLALRPASNSEQVIRNNALPGIAWRQAGALTLKNLALIPDETGLNTLLLAKTPPGSGTASTVTLEDCVLSANNGSDQPLTTTGHDDPETTAANVIALNEGGDGIFAMSWQDRGNMTLNLTRTVIASFSLGGSTANNSDCVINFLQGDAGDYISSFTNINEGCVFAHANRGIQNPYGGYVNVEGTNENPVVFRRLSSYGIWSFSDTTVQPTATRVNHAHFVDLGNSAIYEGAARAFISGVYNTVIANVSAGDGINLTGRGALPPDGEATSTVTIANSVIHDTGVGTVPANIYASTAFDRTVDVTNITLTGNGLPPPVAPDPLLNPVGIYNASTAGAVFNVSNSTLSLSGSNALSDDTAGSGVINLNNVSNAAVAYLNTTNPFAADFYTPTITSAVNEWSVY